MKSGTPLLFTRPMACLPSRGDADGCQTLDLRVAAQCQLASPPGSKAAEWTSSAWRTTIDGLSESREVRLRYLPAEPPASTAVRVVALVVPEAVIEVDVVAVVPS